MHRNMFVLAGTMLFICTTMTAGITGAQETYQLNVREINTIGTWQGCAPAAAANILGFWADNGFDIFGGVAETTSGTVTEAQVDSLLYDLAYNMGTSTSSGGSLGTNVPAAVKKTLLERRVPGCYETDFQFLWNWFPIPDYFKIVDEINNDRPVYIGGSLNPTSVFFGHATCITGYTYDEGFFGKYALLLHDGYKETGGTVEERWITMPVLPTPFTPNGAVMVRINLLEPDDIDCPCGIWNVMYKFSGKDEKEWPAYFTVYGDNTFRAKDLVTSFSGTWKLSDTESWDTEPTITFTLMYNEAAAGAYRASLDGVGNTMDDGTMNISINGQRGTWYAERYSGDPWDDPPELTNPYERSEHISSMAAGTW